MPGVVLDEVSREFGVFRAVDRVSLTIADGEFVTLLGPSGCGKTTTLRMVAGLEQNSGGRITIGQQVVSDAARGLFVGPERRQIGMVFQSYAIWPHMSVFDNVAYPLKIRHRPRREIEEKVLAALRLVEMEGFAARPAPALSGGQQQRVAIARALVFEPAVLLLDEPLSNLDARLRTQMGDEFRALQQRLGITSIYVTHDQEEAMALSDRIAVMRSGRILQVGSPEAIYQRPANVAVASFFGSPNILEARVIACTADGTGDFRLAVEGRGGWQGECHAGEGFLPGEPVLVLVRPENAEIVPPGTMAADRGMAWSGRITGSIFRGARRSMTVDVGGTPIHVEAPAMKAAAPGTEVTLTVETPHAWAIRPELDSIAMAADGRSLPVMHSRLG